MALKPTNTDMDTWLGTGAGITANSTSAGAGFWIPKANVQAYVGSDTVIVDDIRDFLFSVLSKAADTYNEPLPSGDTKATSVKVYRSIDNSGNITFSVTLAGNTVVNPYISTLGTYE